MESAKVSVKPLTREETKMLLSFVESSKIIYNKTTNATTNAMKSDEWKRIADQFNAVVTTSYRTPQQLRLKWENLKKNSRKRKTQIRMNNIKTGGGGPSYIPPDDVLDRVAALLGSTVDGYTVAFGGDAELVPESTNTISGGGGGDGSNDKNGLEGILNLEDVQTSNGAEVLEEFVVTELGACTVNTTPKTKNFVLTPRASGFKRKPKSDENRAARNQALANYYNMKTKILDAKLENILLENKKLKLEIEKLKSND